MITMTSDLKKPVLIKTQVSVELINPDEILYCQIKESVVVIQLLQHAIIVKHTLKELDEMFKSHGFYRCHANCLLNIRKIRRYFHKPGEVQVTNGSMLKVAKDRKPDFYKTLKSYHNFISFA